MSEAYIGYDLQNAIRTECLNRGVHINGCSTIITQTIVEDKPIKPTKPIGHFMTEEKAKEKEY